MNSCAAPTETATKGRKLILHFEYDIQGMGLRFKALVFETQL